MQHSSQSQARAAVQSKSPSASRDFHGVISSLVGQMVTVVTSESFEDAPVGRHLKPGSYRARLHAVGSDFVVLITQYTHRAKSAGSEPVKQFVPLPCIKRVSLMRSELLLHL